MHTSKVRACLFLVLLFLLGSAARGDGIRTSSKRLKRQRVAIVGAGISGLSAAYHLVNAGYNDITIFEETYRTGGWFTSFDYKNVTYDMSAYAISALYWRFRETMESLGAEFCPYEPSLIVPAHGDKPSSIFNVIEFIIGKSAAELDDPRTYPQKLGEQLESYARLWSDLFEVPFLNEFLDTEYLFPPKPPSDPAKLRKLTTPMAKLLQEEGLELLIPIVRTATNTQAYGPMDETAALYVMSWVPPSVLLRREGSIATPCGKHGSFQKLADLLVENFKGKVKIRFGTKVERVLRGRMFAAVVTDAGAREVFHKVIVTRRLPEVEGDSFMVEPVLKIEKELAKSTQSLELYTAMFEGPREGVAGADHFAIYDVLSISPPKNSDKLFGALTHDRREPGGPFHSDPSTLVREFGLYFYDEGTKSKPVRLSNREKDAIILKRAKTWDTTKWKPLRGYSFRRYNQRFPPQDIEKEFPWIVGTKLQGKGQVYFISAHVCGLETVAHLFDCAKHLVDDHF